MTTETPASAETGATSLTDVLNPAPAGNEPGKEAAPNEDAGAAAAEAASGSEPSAQPAPKAETPPHAAQPAPAGNAGDADPANDPRAPKWYREHMQKVNRELAQLRAERTQTPPQRPQPQQTRGPALPDPLEDPEGYGEAVLGIANQRIQEFQILTTLNISERFARQQHGSEKFEECKAWLSTRPDIEAWALQQPDPWGAAFTTYNREQLAEEIGDDPNAWRDRERERLRAEILAEHQAAPPSGMTSQPSRAAPPAPASTARSASVGRDASGRFTTTPLGDALGKR